MDSTKKRMKVICTMIPLLIAVLMATACVPAETGVSTSDQESSLEEDLMDIISDDLQNWDEHASLLALADAFRFLGRSDLGELETGRHEISGSDMYALVQRGESRPVDGAEFEAHRLYLDIQYLISGEEQIGVAPQQGLTVSKPYDVPNDIEFYLNPAQFRKITMHPGRFVVFYPQHAHLPNLYPNRPGPLHKVVVKVSLKYLESSSE
jgi:biofilm protein TabA